MFMSSAERAWREPCGVAETPPEYVFLRPRLYLDTTIPSLRGTNMNELTEDDDPIVAEVRRVREEIAAKFDHDYDRIADYVHQQAREIRERMTRRQHEPSE
jgi:hypothetical protein